jgi:fructose-1,6-bisphosphatase/inositol monophosphatase family enzyme
VAIKSANITRNTWRYFTFHVAKSSAVSLGLRETQTQGVIWMYVGIKQNPVLSSFFDADKGEGRIHQIDIEDDFEGKIVLHSSQI